MSEVTSAGELSSRKYIKNQFSYSSPFLSKWSLTNPTCRILSKFIRVFGYDIAFCRYQSRITFYSLKSDRKNYRNFPKYYSFINLGAGGFRHERWTNYDYPAVSNYYKRVLGREYVDFKPIDLNANLDSIEEENIQACYISHTLEHLPRDSGLKVLKFVYKKLVSGGVIRIAVPDHEIAYINNNFSSSKKIKEEIITNSLHMLSKLNSYDKNKILELHSQSKTCDDFYEKLVRNDPNLIKTDNKHPEYHLSLWSRKYIKELKDIASFDNCIICLKNKSTLLPFTNSAVFDTTEPQHSLYFEIIKD